MQQFRPTQVDDILHNRGCGIAYLQRHHKIPYEALPADSWFFREQLCRQIAIDIPWCLLEPREGEFVWDHPEWEGCFDSWIEHGYKVHLKVRGMDTLGTMYDQGTPQWVFNAGAQYIDEPIEFYRSGWMLNNIPRDGDLPIRYPLYWDPVYLEKADALIAELGRRYNNHPAVESVSISHVGRWGEMHVADHYRPERWIEAGFTMEKYNNALIHTIAAYRRAFPDTQLSLSLGRPIWMDGVTLEDALPAIDYAVSQNVMLKYDGLGKSWEPGSGPYICKSVFDMLNRYSCQTKIMFENLILPEALDCVLQMGASYWQPGGEPPGMASIINVEKDILLPEKRIYSFYKFFQERYDRLTVEDEKNIWRKMARECGYRLALVQADVSEAFSGATFVTRLEWINSGNAPCYEKFNVRLALVDSDANEAWHDEQTPGCDCGANVWGKGKTIREALTWSLPSDLPSGDYELHISLKHTYFHGELMRLANKDEFTPGVYRIGKIRVQ